MENLSADFKKNIELDIERIEHQLKSGSVDSQWSLFLDLNGMYQSCIANFYLGLRGASHDGTMISLPYVQNRPEYIKENLQMLKAKLKALLFGVNTIRNAPINQTQVNVSNNVSVNVSFEQARDDIEKMTSLSKDETDEILRRISAIEEIVKSNETKKQKWERITPIIRWIADKGVDVGIAMLPLILKINEIN